MFSTSSPAGGSCSLWLSGKAKLAVGLSLNDPQLEADDFKQAVEIVESARKAVPKKP